jgi:hypothetical protein
MARITFSAVINSVQGSVGGSVFQKNKSGFTLKNKSINVDSSTEKQILSRSFVSAIQNAWQSMTDAQRNEWSIFANFYPVLNKNNRNVKLTGGQLFMKYNLIRMNAGFSILTTIVYGNIQKFDTSVIFNWLNHELTATVDDGFDPAVWNVLFMISSPRPSGYPVKVKSYKLIPITDIFENHFYLTQDYFNLYSTVPGLGLFLAYKLTIFYMNMPVIQEGPFAIGEIVAP